jgi:PAS domain S-box-containing protein
MSVACGNRWIALFGLLFTIILVIYGPMVNLVRSQNQIENALQHKSVLVLHAHESMAPIFEKTDSALSAALQCGGIVIRNQFYEFLDLRRNPGTEHRRHLAESLRLRYGQRKIDVIITMYPEALQFLLNEGRTIIPEAPILALYLPIGFELPATSHRVIPQFIIPDLSGTLDIALTMLPKSKHLYVVSGAHTIDRWLENRARQDFKQWEDRLDIRYLSNLTLEEILVMVSRAPPDSIVFATTFANDANGKIYTMKDVTRQLASVSNAPVFGMFDMLIGHGIIGGSVISFEHVGTRAGELVLEILSGAKTAEQIPAVLEVPHLAMFDWRQLRHWDLHGGNLPAGSIVLNKELTFWDFRYYIIGALAFITAQSFLIAGLLLQKRRKRSAEESLHQKTEELDQFFNVSLDLLCIANTDGYFLRLNPAWEVILGYSREELMAQRFLDFVHPDDLVKIQGAISTLASQGKVIHFDNRYRCKDGRYRWLEWNAAAVGSVIYAAARDVTKRLNAEFEARQRREELAHVTRIATMGELTTSLAHEINQPLTAILSNAEAAQRFLSRAEPDIGEVRQILEDIIQDDRRAGDVVQKVRALVRKEKSHDEFLDLNKAIQEVVALIRGESLLQGLSISLELNPELKMIRGDRIQLQQVILNLILNSATAMRNAPRAQRKIIVRTTMPDNLTVQVSVMDFGTGIDEKNIERLFEAFYTTKPEGLGMGLSISQTIVNAHGGNLDASNNQEGGATFAFTLPVQQGDAP